MRETSTDSVSARKSVSLPLAGRLFLLAVSLFLFLILNAVGVGAQTDDDHGNSLSTATPLSLGSSVAGRIDPGDDVDVFKLDLSGRSGATDVWMYTTGDLDTFGGLFDNDANLLAFSDDSFVKGRWYNFNLRANLAPGIYYVGVSSFDQTTTGSYTLHAEAVTDPGNTIGTATRLNLSAPTPGTIDTSSDEDYFRLDLAQTTNLYIYALSVYGEPVDGKVFDATNSPVSVNVFSAGLLGFTIRDDFGPGTYYIRVTTPPDADSYPVPYTIHSLEDNAYTNFINNCENAARPSQIDDPLYGCQWHLNNALGEDINVEPVWSDGIKGEGINIAVVDDGMDWNHEDLVDNVDASRNHDYTGYNDVHHPFKHHGTAVAGVIAARDNGIGVRGVAPQATIYGYNYLAVEPTDALMADAMARNSVTTAVSNNSWGPPDRPGLDTVNAFWKQAIKSGLNQGFDGKGVLYVWAGGNGHLEGDNSNLDELANFYAVTAVCAVNDADKRSSYSERGANLWVCAPSNDYDEYRDIITVENSDRYRDDFSGTSSAAPTVSGVAALIRQANPSLTWRDLKLILAASARKNDPTNPGWKDGARKYGSTSAADRYHFNHEYGFGVVDAKAAVDMAKGWSNAPPLKSETAASGSFNFLVPDRPTTGLPTTHHHELSLNTDDIDFTEFVEVNVTFSHESFRDLDVELVSPSGARSQLTVAFDTVTLDDPTDEDLVPLRGTFRFGSARHLGEDPNGVWRLNVSDHIPFVTGTWDSWSIKVYGHSGTQTPMSRCAAQGAVTNAPDNPDLVSDCETLLDVRDTLVGTGTSLNWSASVPIADWDGVMEEGTPARVTQLLLWNRGIRGTIPAQLESLTGLKKLDLGTALEVCVGDVCRDVEEHERNRLTGTIPATLGNLASLESLAMGRNELSGPIPAELGNLSGLTLLALGGNKLTGTVPTWLGDLNNLEWLFLWGNQLSGPIPTELVNLTNLKLLELGSNQLSGSIPSDLGNLASLERLTLHRNQLSETIPTSLGNLSDLEYLSLSHNLLSGSVPTQLGNLSNLKVLSLADNQLTGTIPASLGSLVNLERLYLSQNQLTGCIPASLQNIPDNDLDQMGLPFCSLPTVTLSITSTSVLVRMNSPIPLTATFSEPVFGFTVGEIAVTNSVAGNFAGNDGDSVYTFDVTPNAIGDVAVDIAADVALDAENNGNTAAVRLSLGIPYDDDHDGAINRAEVITAIGDYLFSGTLTRDQVIAIIGLYLFG